MRMSTVTATAVFLFLLQALRVLFSTLFGIIYDQVFEGPLTSWLIISAGLVFAVMLMPLLSTRIDRGRTASALALLAILVRPLLTINAASVRYFGALILTAAAAGYLALVLRRRDLTWRALIWALIAEQVLRALGDTLDLSLQSVSLPVVILICLMLAVWVLRTGFHAQMDEIRAGGISWLPALGLGAFLFLETSLLALPAAIARWADLAYAPLALLVLLATAVPFLLPLGWVSKFGARLLLAFLLLGGVMVGYFGRGWAAGAGLVLAQAGACLGFVLLLSGRDAQRPWKGGPLAVGLLFFLLLNFANAFTFTYPYTLPAMRGLGWVVYGAAGLIVTASFLLPRSTVSDRAPGPAFGLGAAASLAGALVLVIVAIRPLPAAPLPETGTLRLATWNIHYGYDDAWHTTLPEMVEAIAAAGVDVIALQEVDAGRMTSYSVDDAYFLGRRLHMQVAYLPAMEHLTGVALLYKGERGPVESTLLPSQQEQTGIVRARISAGAGEFEAHAIWLGLSDEDTMAQIRAALDFIGSGTRASFGGDFNAEDTEPEIAAVREAGFADPFQLLGIEPAPLTDPAISPIKRIDFVFVRGLIPVRAWVADSLASDHRMVVVEIAAE